MIDDDAHVRTWERWLAGLVITIWEANPKRQALARMLGRPPGSITDDMIRQVERGPATYRSPPIQQFPRGPRRGAPDTPPREPLFTPGPIDLERYTPFWDLSYDAEAGTAKALEREHDDEHPEQGPPHPDGRGDGD